MNICEKLCYYDKRNPIVSNLCDDEETPPRRQGCACDNCFYGRDSLAILLIRCREVMAELITNYSRDGQLSSELLAQCRTVLSDLN